MGLLIVVVAMSQMRLACELGNETCACLYGYLMDCSQTKISPEALDFEQIKLNGKFKPSELKIKQRSFIK